jgi:hypothetical protein
MEILIVGGLLALVVTTFLLYRMAASLQVNK